MYTGTLIIHAFSNDTTDGASYPFTTVVNGAIPLIGQCHTGPHHPKETLTFPTTPTGTDTFTFTIPEYGGQVNEVDTNGDSIPDVPVGCTSVSLGDPLTGSGSLNTTATLVSARTPSNPRGFSLPQSALNKVKTGASAKQYQQYLWEVHYADLHNATGNFAKSGGDGSINIKRKGVEGDRRLVQTAGAHKFGGVMRLLGSYWDNEGFLYMNQTTSVFKFDWLFHYLGHGGQATKFDEVTAGYFASAVNYGYTRASGYPTTSTVFAEVFKWTTGTVFVTANLPTFPTVLERKGYDNRNATGKGVVQLVSPMLTHWVGAEETNTGEIGILNIDFVPEPGQILLLSAGASLLGLLVHARRRW
jgi:hypothetical protein